MRTRAVHLLSLAVTATVAIVAAPDRARGGRCDTYSCGSNSPEVFGNPVGALQVRGDVAHNGLVPGSLVPPDTCRGAVTLDLDGGELVGRDPQGAIVCRSDRLVGAHFKLWVAGVQRELAISEVGTVSTWEAPPAAHEEVRTYRFTDALHGPSICPLRTATWMEPWQLENLTPGAGPAPALCEVPRFVCPIAPTTCDGHTCQWAEATDHALLVQGERYTANGDVAERGAALFNIACAGNALAKMRLLGFDPMSATTTAEERTATLKMLSARYDGVMANTMHGQPLKWLRRPDARGTSVTYYGDPPSWGPIESRWGASGASCLSHLRTWMAPILPAGTAAEAEASEARRVELLATKHLPGKLGFLVALRKLPRLPRCTPTPPAAPPIWTTYSVRHVH